MIGSDSERDHLHSRDGVDVDATTTTTTQGFLENHSDDGGSLQGTGVAPAPAPGEIEKADRERWAEGGSKPPAPVLATPAYGKKDGWDWGLGLGPQGRNKVVCKQGDLLWKSVPGNLAVSTAWFVAEVGLSWDEMRKVGTVLCFFSKGGGARGGGDR